MTFFNIKDPLAGISFYKMLLFLSTVIQNFELFLELPKYSPIASREAPGSEPPGSEPPGGLLSLLQMSGHLPKLPRVACSEEDSRTFYSKLVSQVTLIHNRD